MATQSTKAAVENFVGQHKLAVVGVSRDTKKFGNMAYKALKEKGYQVYPINRNVEAVEGDRCYATLAALPEKVDGVLIVVPPTETEKVVREVDAAGIKNVWMQQGAESDEAIQYCQEHGSERSARRVHHDVCRAGDVVPPLASRRVEVVRQTAEVSWRPWFSK